MVSPDQDGDSENPDMPAHDDTQKKGDKNGAIHNNIKNYYVK